MSNRNLTPREIVDKLNEHIIGQFEAKKSVAIALRNRYRRKLVNKELFNEIIPKNILMVGQTGVGKTEIARRLASLVNAPFIKVEATKFTEVGYVGRDVESIIRDLVELSIKNSKEITKKNFREAAQKSAYDRILKILIGDSPSEETKEKFIQKLNNKEIHDREIEVEINENKSDMGMNGFDIPGAHIGMINISDAISKAIGGKKKKKVKISVGEALEIFTDEESEILIDEDKIIRDSLKNVEQDGIVFIDEIDKVCNKEGYKSGEVSREGVQRDLLPLVEGTTVTTKYGTIKTDHILFIASGAFHLSKPSDLLPELQGRFPVRVNLNSLTVEDFEKILKEPKASLLTQYKALMLVEKVNLIFTDEAIKEIASISFKINSEVENIGARRLHTILEKLLEEISFDSCAEDEKEIVIDLNYVKNQLQNLYKTETDLSKFIL